jgi:UDP-N-acetylglucosamine 1-carboxyvinyltransferase
VTLEGAPCDHLGSFLELLDRIGVNVTCEGNTIQASGVDRDRLRAVDVTTAPYPGLATDLQPPTCVLLTQATGRSHVHETIFEDRLEFLGGLSRMGARIRVRDANHATITGVSPLHGAETEIGDLRAGASMIVAALAAQGTSLIYGAHHVHRGYENIGRKFQELGAAITTVAESPAPKRGSSKGKSASA